MEQIDSLAPHQQESSKDNYHTTVYGNYPRGLYFLVGLSIILSPLYIVRFNFWGLPTTFLEILLLATFLIWIWQKKRLVLTPNPLQWPIAILIFGAIIAVVVSPDQYGALGILKGYFLEPVLFFYLLIDVGWQQKGSDPLFCRRTTIIISLVVAGLYLSLWGILQVIFGLAVVTPHEQLVDRAHGPFNSGNSLALFLAPVFLLALGRLFAFTRGPLTNTKGVPLRIVGQTGLVVTILVGIFLTKSRGGLIGLAGAMSLVGLIWLISKTRWRLRLKYLWLIIPIYVIIVTGGLTQVSHFTPKNNNPWLRPINDTLTPRLCLWDGVVNLLRDRPLLGAGLDGFKTLYSRHYYTCDAEPLQYPHNLLLNFWAELGLLGTLGIFLVLAMFLQRQTQIFLRPQTAQSKFLALSLIGIIFFWLIHGLVDVPYFKNDLSLQFWIIMALGVLNL